MKKRALPTEVETLELSPKELAARIQEAQDADREFRKIWASMVSAKRAMVDICARSLGVDEGGDINRLIWHGIVQYANVDVKTAEGRGQAFLAFQAFTNLFLIRQDRPFETKDIRELAFRDLESEAVRNDANDFGDFYNVCCERLSVLHEDFRTLLSWLANPNAFSAPKKYQAVAFLVEHGGEGAITFDLDPNADFDDSGRHGAPFYYWKIPQQYRTILSPVVSFIVSRIEEYQTDDIKRRLSLREAIPVLRCKRPACGRFTVLHRNTREFCSASCRTLYRQETRPEEHAKYQRKYREMYKKPR
jgi:hypothetical protein